MITTNLPLKSIQIITVKERLCLPPRGMRFLFVLEGGVSVCSQKRPPIPASSPSGSHTPNTEEWTAVPQDGQSFSGKPGEIFCFLPNLNVQVLPLPCVSKVRVICAAFDMEFVRKYLPGWEMLPGELTKALGPSCSYIKELISFMAAAWYGSGSNRELQLMTYCYQLISILADCFKIPYKPASKEERASQITFYLETNYERPITLGELASYLHISSAYLSRYIKAHFRMCFQDYLSKIRMRHALWDLISTKESVTAIALNNGFPNVAALNKALKADLGMTPNQYRQKFGHADPGPDLPEGHEHIAPTADTDFNTVPFKAAEQTAPGAFPFAPAGNTLAPPVSMALKPPSKMVKVPVAPDVKGKLGNGWHDMINLGFGIHCSQIKFQKQLTGLMEKIPFKYGRIQGIFKDYNDTFEQTPSLYSFSEMDSIFDFFVSIHLLPHIDFAFTTHKPEYAGKNPNLELICKFIKYYAKRYGSDALASWRFEYSMPTQDHKRPLQTPEAYADNCRQIEKLIHTLIPGAAFGCFAASPLFPWQFNEEIFQKLAENNVAPDYISIHLFPYEPSPRIWQEFPILSTDEHFFKNYIHKFKTLCKRHRFDSLPLFVTHLQNELGRDTWINDSAFMAPFLFKAYTDIYQDVDTIAYGAFYDMIYENGGDDPYFIGGSGIISKDGIKKPSYFALFMLSKAGSMIFHQSDHCFINSTNYRSCQILMYNYTHYTLKHCLSCHEHYPLAQTYDQLMTGETLVITLDFSHWPAGSYRLQKFRLGPEHGSALDEYIRLGIQDDMLPIELDYLCRKSGLDISVQYIEINERTVLNEQLSPMEICIYVIYAAV